jgi:hypothetical protein
VLRDADATRRLVATIPVVPHLLQTIVVDGGHDTRLEPIIAARPDMTLCRTAAGRAHQMNAGAEAASSEWLLFLHADSELPEGWLEAFSKLDPGTIGGWFRFGLDDSAWQARVLEWLVAWRVRLFQLPYGDQGLFVRRSAFHAMGGFAEISFLEDVEFVRRLVRRGPVTELPLTLRTSSRRWRRDGWLRRSFINAVIVCLYCLGASPARLFRWYRSANA